jgi:hypothetical protein
MKSTIRSATLPLPLDYSAVGRNRLSTCLGESCLVGG